MSGQVEFVSTRLTAAVDADDTTFSVRSTVGLPDRGVVAVEGENIAYSSKTTTTLYGTLTTPLIRGTQGTEAAAHAVNSIVSTVPASMMGMSAAYDVVALTDASGPRAIVVAPLALFRLFGSFFSPHLEFLGTDLAIITYLWMILMIGMVVSLAIALFGR